MSLADTEKAALIMRIVVEGTNVQPLVVDQIQIFAAQRYSFVLNANQPVDNYCESCPSY